MGPRCRLLMRWGDDKRVGLADTNEDLPCEYGWQVQLRALTVHVQDMTLVALTSSWAGLTLEWHAYDALPYEASLIVVIKPANLSRPWTPVITSPLPSGCPTHSLQPSPDGGPCACSVGAAAPARAPLAGAAGHARSRAASSVHHHPPALHPPRPGTPCIHDAPPPAPSEHLSRCPSSLHAPVLLRPECAASVPSVQAAFRDLLCPVCPAASLQPMLNAGCKGCCACQSAASRSAECLFQDSQETSFFHFKQHHHSCSG